MGRSVGGGGHRPHPRDAAGGVRPAAGYRFPSVGASVITCGHARRIAISSAPRGAPDAVTRPGAWRPVEARGRSHRVPVPEATRTRASRLRRRASTHTASRRAPKNGSHAGLDLRLLPRPECRACVRMARLAVPVPRRTSRACGAPERMTGHADLVMVERAEREADKTVDCVCRTCRDGWMQRLEDNVEPVPASR